MFIRSFDKSCAGRVTPPPRQRYVSFGTPVRRAKNKDIRPNHPYSSFKKYPKFLFGIKFWKTFPTFEDFKIFSIKQTSDGVYTCETNGGGGHPGKRGRFNQDPWIHAENVDSPAKLLTRRRTCQDLFTWHNFLPSFKVEVKIEPTNNAWVMMMQWQPWVTEHCRAQNLFFQSRDHYVLKIRWCNLTLKTLFFIGLEEFGTIKVSKTISQTTDKVMIIKVVISVFFHFVIPKIGPECEISWHLKKFLSQIALKLKEIDAERHKKLKKFACGALRRIKCIKTINNEIIIKKIHIHGKQQKHWWSSPPHLAPTFQVPLFSILYTVEVRWGSESPNICFFGF